MATTKNGRGRPTSNWSSDPGIIAWETPNNTTGTGHHHSWAATAEQLIAKPGKWAVVKESKTNSSLSTQKTSINRPYNKIYRGFEPGPNGQVRFRAAVSKRTNGKYGLYVVYIGENGEHDPETAPPPEVVLETPGQG